MQERERPWQRLPESNFFQRGGDNLTRIQTRDLNDGFEILMEGHAGEAEYGKNILCACLSTYVMMAQDLLEILRDKEGFRYGHVHVKPGFAHIVAGGSGRVYDILRIFREAFLMAMERATEEYPEAVKAEPWNFQEGEIENEDEFTELCTGGSC